jgi:hypothetical protein
MPLLLHIVLAALTLSGFRWVQSVLDASYAASQHPVDYFTGQTRFNGETVKDYYAVMQELGTLDIYWQTQIIDFGFIVSVMCMGLFFCTLVSRLARAESWGRTFGIYAAASAILGAFCDATENVISFVMLSSPQEFPNWLALPYSGFAAIKFGLITLAMLLLIACIVTAFLGKMIKKPGLG